MIFGKSIPEARKTVVAIISLIGAVVAIFFTGYDPNFTQACVALAGALFAVAGVFMAKNHTEKDLSKAVSQLQGAALTVVGYFVTVQPDTAHQIAILSGAVVSVFAVFWISNDTPYTKVSELES